MCRDTLIKLVLDNLLKLSDQKIEEVTNFTEFLLSKSEDSILIEGIQKMANESKSFNFLNDEEEIYTVADLKEIYN